MASHSLQEVTEILGEGKYNTLALYKLVPSDEDTVVTAYLKATGAKKSSFLLEQVKQAEHRMRYAFIGCDPFQEVVEIKVDPLLGVEAEMSKYKLYPDRNLPEFTGGAVGYVGYDCVRFWEDTVPVYDRNDLKIPDSIMMYYQNLILFDHAAPMMKVVSHIHVADSKASVADLYAAAVAAIDSMCERLRGPIPVIELPLRSSSSHANIEHPENMTSNHGPEGYKGFVTSLKKDIFAGNIIQAVPSQRLSRPMHPDLHPFDIYRELRHVNPSPYMYYFNFGEFQVMLH
jgi:anthranilate synthase component 1